MYNTKVILDDFRVNDILEHHGVKGQKWGIRNAVRKDAKAKVRFVKTVNKSVPAIYGDAVHAMNHHVANQINNKPEFRHIDFSKPGRLTDKYHHDMAEAFAGELDKAYNKHVGSQNRYATHKAQFLVEPGTLTPYMNVTKNEAMHSSEDSYKFPVTLDNTKRIVSISFPTTTALMQSAITDILEHHGVKGMHWGFRNARIPKTLSSDHKEAAGLKRKPAHELSNKDLQTINNRLNLEQNYNRMNPGKVEAGHKRVQRILTLAGTGVTAYSLFHSPAGKALRNLGSRRINQQLHLF